MRDELRLRYKARLAALKHNLRQQAATLPLAHSGTDTLLTRHGAGVDTLLQALWRELDMPPSFSLIAVGGYGRGELFPFSDVDVLVLIDRASDSASQTQLENFFSVCWDIGFEMGHSVRTVEECLSEAQKDGTVQTALLETRLICGAPDSLTALHRQFFLQLEPARFFRLKMLELRQRHTRFHDTPYALEPNCKEGPGGLRDLHTIVWLARAAGLGDSWSKMALKGLLTAREASQLRRHERLLKSLRLHLHWLAERREDRLTFDVQTGLAEKLGLTTRPGRRPSELLMQSYYRAARAIWLLSTMLLQNLERLLQQEPPQQPSIIDRDFQASGGLLDMRHPDLFKRRPPALLRAFTVLQRHSELSGMSVRLLRALWHERFRINAAFRAEPANRKRFREFLRYPDGIVHALRLMSQTDILGRYLPVFGKIVGQMQHDLFHVYTVDQHTLMVLRNLRRFTMAEHAHEYPLCSRLMGNFDAPWLLYVAALFHDIAKGRGGDHSELGALEAQKFCEQHFIGKRDTAFVIFLVQHHLTMSNTAQRQDLSEPATIRRFAAIVKTERRLVGLYMLTVADIRGTSPKVWNAWKGKLLEDLFAQTLLVLKGSAPSSGQRRLADKQEDAQRLLRLSALPDDVHEKLWATLDVGYFLRTDAPDIAWHARQLAGQVETPQPIVRGRLSALGEGLQILVYCRDQPDLFARICAYFHSQNLDVLDAKIHTTQRGYALDSFMLADPEQVATYRELISLIETGLRTHLQTVAPLPLPTRGRGSRQSKHFPHPPSVALQHDESGTFFLLSLTATDRRGLLYAIAYVLARFRVSLHTAKIMTLGERVEDSFLLDASRLASEKTRVRLETELLEAVG